jgi:hypothetical protein
MKFRAVIFAAAVLGWTASSAFGAGKIFDFTLQSLTLTDGFGEVTVKATNKTGKFVSRMAIRCEFKDQGGKTIDVGWRRNLVLAAGKTDVFKVRGKTKISTLRSVNCHLSF